MRFSLLTFLLIVFVTPLFAKNFFEVEWSEFCPRRYANIETDKFYLTGDARYWAQRKKVFDRRVERCNTFSGEDKEACFASLREIELASTQAHSQENTAKNIKRLMLKTMF